MSTFSSHLEKARQSSKLCIYTLVVTAAMLHANKNDNEKKSNWPARHPTHTEIKMGGFKLAGNWNPETDLLLHLTQTWLLGSGQDRLEDSTSVTSETRTSEECMKGSKPPADQRQMKQEHFKVAHDAKKHLFFLTISCYCWLSVNRPWNRKVHPFTSFASTAFYTHTCKSPPCDVT